MGFFSILLPGALLTYQLKGEVGLVASGDRFDTLARAESWVAFLFASYLFGHLVSLLGSWLDEFYNWARRRTLDSQIPMLVRRDRLPPWAVRSLIWLVFKNDRNLAVNRAQRIKQRGASALKAKNSETASLTQEQSLTNPN